MINWKLRYQNKTVLCAIVAQVVAVVYMAMGLFGIVPAVTENTLVTFGGMVVELLVLLGVVTDPTTAGVSDSRQAMSYESPKR